MQLPFIDLKPAAALVSDTAQAAWQQAVANTQFVGGSAVNALETTLAEQLGCRHAIACGNGTDALTIALRALGVGPNSTVALPNFTFWATYEAVAQLGAQAVLIDIGSDLQMDLDELSRAHEKHPLDAAILVHLMGWASPHIAEFRIFCAEREIALLEDGAQSYGVEVAGESVYQGAHLSTLSFYPAKVIGGCMDGGAMMCDDDGLAAMLRKLCNHGRSSHYGHSHVGYNSRMGGLQAIWLDQMLAHGDTIVQQRRAHEQAYREALANADVDLVGPPAGVAGNGYLNVCLLREQNRDAIAKHLRDAQVGSGWVYPQTIDAQPPAKDALRVSDLRRSKELCPRILNLPLYFGMTSSQREHACATMLAALSEES